MSDPASPDPDGPNSGGLWSKLLALPPACSIVASLSVVWTLGPVGDWLLTYWLPVTRWFWEATLGRILWFTLSPEQKDILTLTALLFPLYWTSRHKPVIPGVQMNRRRLLAMILAIAIIGLMAQSLLWDAGSFFGGGLWGFVELFIGWLSVLLIFLTVITPIGLFFAFDKSQSDRPANYIHPDTGQPLSSTRRRLHALLLFVLLTLSLSHAVARLIVVWDTGIRVEVWSVGPLIFLPNHPLFILVLGFIGIPLSKKILGGARLVKAGTPARAAKQANSERKPATPKKNNDAFALLLFALVFLIGGYQAVGLPKTLLLIFFALMIGVIAIRNPHRMLQLGQTIVFLLGCAFGVALFDQFIGLMEAASQGVAARISD